MLIILFCIFLYIYVARLDGLIHIARLYQIQNENELLKFNWSKQMEDENQIFDEIPAILQQKKYIVWKWTKVEVKQI